MGAWGVGIVQNDSVLDVVGTFTGHLRRTQSVAEATAGVLADFAHGLADPEEGAQIRIGLALAQWRFGALEAARLQAIRDDLAARRGIASYGALAAARAKAVQAFVAKLAVPSAKPRAIPRPARVAKHPKPPKPAAFAAGTCLALKVRDGWRAALVLLEDVAGSGDAFNVVALLDWKGANAPRLRVFTGPEGAATPRVRAIAMYPHAPYVGKARATAVGLVDVDPARFGIEKTPRFWTWRYANSNDVLAFERWEELPNLRRE